MYGRREMMKFAQSCKVCIMSLAVLHAARACAFAGSVTNQFCNIQREPDVVLAITEANSCNLKPELKGVWSNDQVKVMFKSRGKQLNIKLAAANVAVKWLQIRWNAKLPSDWKCLGDAWERAYGGLEWKPLDSDRIMPWYF